MTGVTSPAFSSAVDLLDRLARRELSARELLDLHLARIETFNPTYNIVVETAVDKARAAAAAIDDARARGDELGPLAGLPMTIKDAFEVVGMKATCGMPSLADHVPLRDADAVERLRAAGVDLLPIPENYYDDLDVRIDLAPGALDRLRANNVLYDRHGAGEYFQAYTKDFDGGFFFEIVQRRGYAGFGAANAPIRLAAQTRLARHPAIPRR